MKCIQRIIKRITSHLIILDVVNSIIFLSDVNMFLIQKTHLVAVYHSVVLLVPPEPELVDLTLLDSLEVLLVMEDHHLLQEQDHRYLILDIQVSKPRRHLH